MLEIKFNSVGAYILNTVNNRVVTSTVTEEETIEIKSLIPAQYWDTVTYDPNVEYELDHFSNRDEKIPAFVREFEFTNVVYKDEVIRSFIVGIGLYGEEDYQEKAEQFKRDLEYYGIKLI